MRWKSVVLFASLDSVSSLEGLPAVRFLLLLARRWKIVCVSFFKVGEAGLRFDRSLRPIRACGVGMCVVVGEGKMLFISSVLVVSLFFHRSVVFMGEISVVRVIGDWFGVVMVGGVFIGVSSKCVVWGSSVGVVSSMCCSGISRCCKATVCGSCVVTFDIPHFVNALDVLCGICGSRRTSVIYFDRGFLGQRLLTS